MTLDSKPTLLLENCALLAEDKTGRLHPARIEEAKKLLQRGVYDPAAITLPYMLPPGTPKQRVQELRRAFQETLMDKEFLAEMTKAGLDIDPLTGEHVKKIVHGFFDLERSLVAKLDEILFGTK